MRFQRCKAYPDTAEKEIQLNQVKSVRPRLRPTPFASDPICVRPQLPSTKQGILGLHHLQELCMLHDSVAALTKPWYAIAQGHIENQY